MSLGPVTLVWGVGVWTCNPYDSFLPNTGELCKDSISMT